MANGDAYCWGRTAYGRLGQTVNSTDAVLSPLKVPGNIQWENIEAGRYHTCAVASTGVAYCWVMASAMLRADARCGRTGRLDVRADQRRQHASCAVTTDDKVYCWGYNANGAVGDGTTVERLLPVWVRLD